MGIKNLLKALHPLHRRIHLSQLASQWVGVDAMVWMHRGAIASAEAHFLGRAADTRFVAFVLSMVELLRGCGVRPVLVFDGRPLREKRAENRARAEARAAAADAVRQQLAEGRRIDDPAVARNLHAAVRVTPEMVFKTLECLRLAAVPFLVAPFEADAQLAFLARAGVVAAVVTEDSDLLAYGCPRTIFKLNKAGEGLVLELDRWLAGAAGDAEGGANGGAESANAADAEGGAAGAAFGAAIGAGAVPEGGASAEASGGGAGSGEAGVRAAEGGAWAAKGGARAADGSDQFSEGGAADVARGAGAAEAAGRTATTAADGAAGAVGESTARCARGGSDGSGYGRGPGSGPGPGLRPAGAIGGSRGATRPVQAAAGGGDGGPAAAGGAGAGAAGGEFLPDPLEGPAAASSSDDTGSETSDGGGDGDESNGENYNMEAATPNVLNRCAKGDMSVCAPPQPAAAAAAAAAAATPIPLFAKLDDTKSTDDELENVFPDAPGDPTATRANGAKKEKGNKFREAGVKRETLGCGSAAPLAAEEKPAGMAKSAAAAATATAGGPRRNSLDAFLMPRAEIVKLSPERPLQAKAAPAAGVPATTRQRQSIQFTLSRLTLPAFQLACVLAGCDYTSDVRIPGLGIATALKTVKACGEPSLHRVFAFLKRTAEARAQKAGRKRAPKSLSQKLPLPEADNSDDEGGGRAIFDFESVLCRYEEALEMFTTHVVYDLRTNRLIRIDGGNPDGKGGNTDGTAALSAGYDLFLEIVGVVDPTTKKRRDQKSILSEHEKNLLAARNSITHWRMEFEEFALRNRYEKLFGPHRPRITENVADAFFMCGGSDGGIVAGNSDRNSVRVGEPAAGPAAACAASGVAAAPRGSDGSPDRSSAPPATSTAAQRKRHYLSRMSLPSLSARPAKFPCRSPQRPRRSAEPAAEAEALLAAGLPSPPRPPSAVIVASAPAGRIRRAVDFSVTMRSAAA